MLRLNVRCSELDRVFNCAHSLFLPKTSHETQYTIDGTGQHDLAFKYLNSKYINEFDDNMNENTRAYCLYLKSKSNELVLEQSYTEDLGDFDLSGHPDAYYIDGTTLEIVDLKNGHNSVSPLTNQLKGYAYLITREFKHKKFRKIILTVFQDCQPSSIVINGKILRDFVRRLKRTVKLKNIQPGTHCQFCNRKAHCVALRVNYETDDLNDMVYILKHKSAIKSSITSIEKKILSEYPDWFVKVKCGKGYSNKFIGENSNVDFD